MKYSKQTLYRILSSALPEAAIQQHPSKKYLSTIKAQYVIERLNLVFGVGGWSLTGKCTPGNAGVLYEGLLSVPEYSIEIETVGYKAFGKEEDAGDSFKGARTDALSKACSWIGIGNEIFKGAGNVEHQPVLSIPYEYQTCVKAIDYCLNNGISEDQILTSLRGLIDEQRAKMDASKKVD